MRIITPNILGFRFPCLKYFLRNFHRSVAYIPLSSVRFHLTTTHVNLPILHYGHNQRMNLVLIQSWLVIIRFQESYANIPIIIEMVAIISNCMVWTNTINIRLTYTFVSFTFSFLLIYTLNLCRQSRKCLITN